MSQSHMEAPSYSLISEALLVNSIVFLLLANISVALRFYARKISSLQLKWDDWTIVLSLAMSWFYSINTFVAAGIGGVSMTKLDPVNAIELFERCLWIEGIPLGIGLATIKISVLLYYRRIFVTKPFKMCVDGMVVVLIGWAISTVIALLLISDPISASWKGGRLRYDFAAFTFAVAGMSIVFDVLVLCFPLPVIKNLRMPTRRKLQVAGIFWLGSFCCIAAAVRFYYLYKGQQGVLATQGHNQYVYTTPEFLWAHIEPNCSIVAACLPTYGPLFIANKGFREWISSLRSFMSLASLSSKPSRQRPGSQVIKGNAGESGSGLVVDSKDNGHWQRLGKSDSSDIGVNNVVDVAGGMKVENEDLEAQQQGTAPLKIAVKRGFETEY